MKIKNLREVKARLSQIVNDLPDDHSVIITKKGEKKGFTKFEDLPD